MANFEFLKKNTDEAYTHDWVFRCLTNYRSYRMGVRKMYRGAGWAHCKEFFTEIEARNYFVALHSKMKSEVEQMSDAEIVSCNFQEWADYLADKYSIVPISIFETNIERSLSETKVKKENPFHKQSFFYQYFFTSIFLISIAETIPTATPAIIPDTVRGMRL